MEEESQTLQNPQVSEGWRGDLADTFGDGESSFQRAEGTSGKDLAPRWSPRVRTSLCDFHLELSPPSHRSHMTFLGEGKSQIGALHKNSLMENSRSKEPVNMGECKPPIRASLQPERYSRLGYHSASYSSKETHPGKAPDPDCWLRKSLAPIFMAVGVGGIIHSFLAGCFPSHPQSTARFPRFL